MRIAFFSWEALHAIAVGGVATHVSHLAEALSRQGHEVHLFTRRGRGQRLEDVIGGVRYHRCPFNRCQDFLDETEEMGRAMEHYFREAEAATGAFDIIHVYDWLTVTAGLRAAADRRFAITFHSTELGRSGVWPESGGARRIADLEQAAIQEADAVIGVSCEIRRELDSLYSPPDWKTGVIYHGVDLANFDKDDFDPARVKAGVGIEPMDPTVLFVGRLRHRKGPDLLLNAVPCVLAQRPEAKFLFVGEGDMQPHLEREIERRDLGGAVKLLGWRQGEELAQLYRASDQVCLSSRSEPYGMAALSAWAGETPVVATKAGCFGELVLDETNGFLVEQDGIAEAILKGFGDFEQLRWMGRNGRVTVETAFSWDAVATETLKLYRRKEMLGA